MDDTRTDRERTTDLARQVGAGFRLINRKLDDLAMGQDRLEAGQRARSFPS